MQAFGATRTKQPAQRDGKQNVPIVAIALRGSGILTKEAAAQDKSTSPSARLAALTQLSGKESEGALLRIIRDRADKLEVRCAAVARLPETSIEAMGRMLILPSTPPALRDAITKRFGLILKEE